MLTVSTEDKISPLWLWWSRGWSSVLHRIKILLCRCCHFRFWLVWRLDKGQTGSGTVLQTGAAMTIEDTWGWDKYCSCLSIQCLPSYGTCLVTTNTNFCHTGRMEGRIARKDGRMMLPQGLGWCGTHTGCAQPSLPFKMCVPSGTVVWSLLKDFSFSLNQKHLKIKSFA